MLVGLVAREADPEMSIQPSPAEVALAEDIALPKGGRSQILTQVQHVVRVPCGRDEAVAKQVSQRCHVSIAGPEGGAIGGPAHIHTRVTVLMEQIDERFHERRICGRGGFPVKALEVGLDEDPQLARADGSATLLGLQRLPYATLVKGPREEVRWRQGLVIDHDHARRQRVSPPRKQPCARKTRSW